MRRTKLTTLICALAVLGASAFAAAASIPVAVFTFTNQADLTSFIKIAGGKCVPKLGPGAVMNVKDGDSPECAFRTSVVADSSDTAPTQDIQSNVGYDPKTASTMTRKLYVSIFARGSATGRYELRVIPSKQAWQLIRDPDGTPPPVVLKSGTGKFIKPGAAGASTTKPGTQTKSATAAATQTQPQNQTQSQPKTKTSAVNLLRLRVSGGSPTTGATLGATINGTPVFNGVDPNIGPPTGRFNGIAVGNKTGKPGTGIIGSFDNVTVRVPSPV